MFNIYLIAMKICGYGIDNNLLAIREEGEFPSFVAEALWVFSALPSSCGPLPGGCRANQTKCLSEDASRFSVFFHRLSFITESGTSLVWFSVDLFPLLSFKPTIPIFPYISHEFPVASRASGLRDWLHLCQSQLLPGLTILTTRKTLQVTTASAICGV